MITSKLLRKVNDLPITKEEMREYLGSLQCVDEPPSHAHTVEVGMSVFNDDSAKCFALNVRLEALNRILSSGELHGWVKDSGEEDCYFIPESVFIAAGVTPMIADGSKMSFRKDDLLQAAFKVGKT